MRLMSRHFKIPYGDGFQQLSVPEHLYIKEVGRDYNDHHQSVDIENEIHNGDLHDFLASVNRLLIIINDHTRFTPSGEILTSLRGKIKGHSDYEILIATGAHRSPTNSELKLLLGASYGDFKDKTRAHDSLDEKAHFPAGTISSGIDIHLDRAVERFDNILVIGSTEPHFFAGFTGGRKGIFPGVALKSSIIANHVKAIDRDVQPLELDNPIHRDMDEVIDLLEGKNIFSIQTVHNPDRGVAKIFCGDLRDSFEQAVGLARRLYVKETDRRFDIVIAIVTPPLDIDLYQIQKGFENTKFAVKPGGICILVSQCRDGIGPDDWLKLSSRYDTPKQVLSNSQDARMFGFHKLYRPARFMSRSRIFVVADVEGYLIKSVFLTPKPNVQAAVDDAIKISPPNPSILMVYDAAQNVIAVKQTKNS